MASTHKKRIATTKLAFLDYVAAAPSMTLALLLMTAPIGITPVFERALALHGALISPPIITRVMLFPIVPPLLGLAVGWLVIAATTGLSTVTRRRILLLLAFVSALTSVGLYLYGFYAATSALEGGSS